MKLIILTAVLSVFMQAVPAFASDATTESERALLIKAASELEYIRTLLDRAQNKQSQSKRIQFDYASLDADLLDIQSSIERHANTPRRSPRKIHPLSKRYMHK